VRAALKKAIAELGPSGLDWRSAIRRDLAALNKSDWQAPMQSITQTLWRRSTTDPHCRAFCASIAKAPQELQQAVPNPARVRDEQRDFAEQLQQIRSAF
jgi:hypothetical protein